MTRVCIVGAPEVDLREELLSRETARDALATYDLHAPWTNTVALETVSLGAAVALCNDLDWYLTRFADAAIVREPSISETEWLSRALARQIRDGRVEPDESADLLKLYGVLDGKLVEPLYVRRTDGEIPTYDLREVDETVVVRVSESEFGT